MAKIILTPNTRETFERCLTGKPWTREYLQNITDKELMMLFTSQSGGIYADCKPVWNPVFVAGNQTRTWEEQVAIVARVEDN